MVAIVNETTVWVETGVWNAFKANLVMLGPSLCGACFSFMAKSMLMGLQANERDETAYIQFVAMIATIFFFGWGFDGCRASAVKVLMVLALSTFIMVVLCVKGYILYLKPIVIVLCTMTAVGTYVTISAHMIFESAGHIVSTSATLMIMLVSIPYLLINPYMTIFATSAVLQLVLLGVLTGLSLLLFHHGLPKVHTEYVVVHH